MILKLVLITILSIISFTCTHPSNPQASAIQNAGITLPQGRYTFTNLQTGQKLKYNPQGNHIFPSNVNPGTPISLIKHPSANWIRLSFGSKDKCLSSAWGGSFDNAAVAYACAVGPGAQRSTLEQNKQWWILVPINAHIGKRSVIDSDSEFNSTEQVLHFEKRRSRGRGKHHHHHHGGKTGSSSGTYYIIPVDHLFDMSTRALAGEVVQSRGIRSTQINNLQMGNTAQQWRITAH